MRKPRGMRAAALEHMPMDLRGHRWGARQYHPATIASLVREGWAVIVQLDGRPWVVALR